MLDAILLLKISPLSPIALSDSDTAVHCDMVPESCMQVRNYLREDFVMHSSSKGSSDAEKRFQPAARRVFFAYRDVGTSRKARMPGVTRQGWSQRASCPLATLYVPVHCRYVATVRDAGNDTPGMASCAQVYEAVASSPRTGKLSGLLLCQPVGRSQKDFIELGLGRVGLGVPVVAPGHFRWQ